MTEAEKKSIYRYDPLVLAWIGDAYLTLAIREWLVKNSSAGSGALHTKMKKYISAVAQSKSWENMQTILTQEEQDIGRKARNRHNSTTAKNSTIAEYKRATALEAVVGYHYLTQNKERLDELFNFIIKEHTLDESPSSNT